jgi:hypothetical protein
VRGHDCLEHLDGGRLFADQDDLGSAATPDLPDELMTLRGERQLLLIENGYPGIAERTPWFQDEELKKLR